ncbi:MAG: hypothetical protein L0Y60_17065 [Beijerinckiaceae bacterium]|nr:hypothetical protein [Beijerinckiaceae bacterium]
MPPLDAATPAHRDDDAGRQECATLGSSHVSDSAPPKPIQDLSSVARAKSTAATQAIADLRREFVAECLRVAAIKAAHGADNVFLGDDLNAERDIRIAVENIREAARSFREWQLAAGAVP